MHRDIPTESNKEQIAEKSKSQKKHYEQSLERRNDYGAKGLTPYNAINRIRTCGKALMVLR